MVILMDKRLRLLAIILLGMIFLLLARLVQIQLIDTEHFSARNINLLQESVRQRSQEMIIDHGRGKFYDRNGLSLTEETRPSLILFPFLKHLDFDIEILAEILGEDVGALEKAIEESKEPFVYGDPEPLQLTPQQMEEINRLRIPGVFAVTKSFPREQTLAGQLIGIVGENPELLKKRYPDKKLPIDTLIGITGLQKSFDEFLLQEEQAKLIYHVDGRGGPLFGIDVKYVEPANPFYPVRIKTTLDYYIQQEAERIVDAHGMEKGGLVLLDIETNSILALVSRPHLNLADPFANDSAKNFMLTAEIPGSIFKTVIAAAALEQNLVEGNRHFNCDLTITGEPEPRALGELDLMASFAVSCNNTFGTLAKELSMIDPGLIEQYAEKLGLLQPVGWRGNIFHMQDFRQLADEESGKIFHYDTERKDLNYVALTGIGQHNVRLTPLAVANMMATIARGGDKYSVRAVEKIEYKDGSEFITFPMKKLGGDRLSPYATMKLQQLLREVVKHEAGTGRGLSDLPYSVAGKSGTAETHIFQGEKQLVNKWFAGYFPFEQPKYVLVIVNLDVFSSEGSVIPIYRDMVNYLDKLDQRKNFEKNSL